MFGIAKIFLGKYALLLGLAGALLLLAALGAQTLRLGSAQVDLAVLKAEVAQVNAERSNAAAITATRHRETEQQLIATAQSTKKADDEKIRNLAAAAARLERLLRDRPSRPAAPRAGDVPAAATPAGSGSGSGPGATGAQLYAEDGKFLAGETARAERLIVQRDSCIAQYRRAEALLNGGARP